MTTKKKAATSFTRKPLPVTAFQIPSTDLETDQEAEGKPDGVAVDVTGLKEWPEWLQSLWAVDPYSGATMLQRTENDGQPVLHFAKFPNKDGIYNLMLRNRDGSETVVRAGDFMVLGSQGEVYPVSFEAFLATHDEKK